MYTHNIDFNKSIICGALFKHYGKLYYIKFVFVSKFFLILSIYLTSSSKLDLKTIISNITQIQFKISLKDKEIRMHHE